MVDFESKLGYDVNDLKKLMKLLRSPEGCPWDREQSHKSIRRNMLEEAYEVAEAIDEEDPDNLLEELGDVLMQIVFHADIAEQTGQFTLEDIADATCRKLIRRHPHVFENISVTNGDQSLVVWEKIKRQEKHHSTTTEAMKSTAKSLPALWRAEKIQAKAAKTGFDWPDHTGALDTLKEELSELEEAITTGANIKETITTGANIKEELGDILFSVVNVARMLKIDPEEALTMSSEKFISRFEKMEKTILDHGNTLTDMTLDEMETVYQRVKLEK